MIYSPEDLTMITEVELVYRNKTKVSDRPKVKHSGDAHALLRRVWDEDKIELQEQCKIMLLDRKNSCLGISTVATGGITHCLVDLKIAFATALKSRATNLIIAHNHPSGNLKPSEADKRLTRTFIEAAKLFDITILDHIILTKESYTSLADQGVIPLTS